MVIKGGTLLIPSGPSHDPDRRHLFVICTAPDASGKTVIVSMATWTNSLCDDTCLLEAHEHQWLRHRSYVLYRDARIEDANHLAEGLRRKLFVAREAMNAQALLKVVNGLCRSPHTPRKVKRHLGC